VDAALCVTGEFSRATGDATLRAAAIARPLTWDTSYFGLPMGRLDYVLCTPEATADDRRAAGAAFNTLKEGIQQTLDRFAARQASAAGLSTFDATMPARSTWRGSLHPVTLVIDEICEIFRELLHHRAWPGGGDGVVQLRRAQLPARSSGDGAARHAVSG
jgi:hypothetical protein